MKALILAAEDRTAYIGDIPRPEPAANELLIRVKAVALNPIDPLYVAHPLGDSGRTVGSDFAGTIIQTGGDVPPDADLGVGNEVAGFLQGACSVNERPGAFAEFVVVPWDLVWKVPKSVTLEQAAGVSLVALTSAQAIWYRLGMEAPFAYDREQVFQEHPEWKSAAPSRWDEADVINVFVYGASTSVRNRAAKLSSCTAQLARLGGSFSKQSHTGMTLSLTTKTLTGQSKSEGLLAALGYTMHSTVFLKLVPSSVPVRPSHAMGR
jgi:NADPH:quinone reductase-like Zn-dependent oxidoreductase